MVALYFARQDKRIRLRVGAGHRIIVSSGQNGPHPDYLAIKITNIGHREAQVVGIGWRIGLFRKRHADQLLMLNDGISSQMPIRLRDGDEATYYIPLFGEADWLSKFVHEMLSPRVKWNSWFTRVCVYTSVGKTFKAPLEIGLKRRIIDYEMRMRMK